MVLQLTTRVPLRGWKRPLSRKKSFRSLNLSNTWNIISSYKKILVTCYSCDAEDYIAPKYPLPCNEENIKGVKEAHESSCGSGSGCGKGGQCNNDRGTWKRDKDKPNGGDNNVNRNNVGNGVQERENI